ncbi:MAG: hypothetical protein AABY22_08175 [Nanoarchaeota archaeon]
MNKSIKQINIGYKETNNKIGITLEDFELIGIINYLERQRDMTNGILKDKDNKDTKWKKELKEDLEFNEYLLAKMASIAIQKKLIE